MDIYDSERYQKIHVWVGSNFSSDAEYAAYFELDYSTELDDPAYRVCGFCRDIGIRWYDEDFIGIIQRWPQAVGLDEVLTASSVDSSDLPRLRALCVEKGIQRANAIFWYSDGGTVVSEPTKSSYNGLTYIGLFEGD